MTIGDFLSKLPEPFASRLQGMTVQELVNALPKDLFDVLMAAVRERFRRDIPKLPTGEEWRMFTSGKRIEAISLLRGRIGCTAAEAHQIFTTSRLDTFVLDVFARDDGPEE